MTFNASLSARQTAPGVPIKVIARQAINGAADYEGNTDGGIGVKVGATPPVNVSEFAEKFFAYTAGAKQVQNTRVLATDGVNTGVTYLVQQNRTIPLSATVVAGRYLFSYLEGPDGVVQAVSTGYLII